MPLDESQSKRLGFLVNQDAIPGGSKSIAELVACLEGVVGKGKDSMRGVLLVI